MGILRYANNLVWLNPMPQNRWINTTAEGIVQTCSVPMYSLIEAGKFGFLQSIKALMGKT